MDFSTLMTQGGLGLLAGASIYVNITLWKRLSEKDEKIYALLDKQNEILKALRKEEAIS